MQDAVFHFISTGIQFLIGYNLVLPAILLGIYGFSRLMPVKAAKSATTPSNYAVIVTAYGDASQLNDVVTSLLNLDYPNYQIYIVADNCDVTGISFSDPRVSLLQPETVLASNTASHFYAIKNFNKEHTHLTIIDSDNLVAPDYLSQLDRYFSAGFQAVQGVRLPKNLDTTYARLDAARDIYYHFFDGEVLFNIGSSATLSGSGMAFTTALYRECLENKPVSGAGFDKVLQYEIVKRGHRIAFSQAAKVYDEKTSRPGQLVNQRARWINTWFRYSGYGLRLAGLGISQMNWNQFLFGVILLRPPIFIFIILSLICLLLNAVLNAEFLWTWISAFAVFILSFFASLIIQKAPPLVYRELVNIPRFIFLQVVSLLKARRANAMSVATEHFHNSENYTVGEKR